MTDTDAPTTAVLTETEIVEIESRLDAVPGGDWHSALGSGHNAMTAVMADVPDGEDDYEPVFICDVIPEYRVEDPQVWENRVPLLTFIENAPSDIRFLLASRDAALALAEQRAEALRAIREKAYEEDRYAWHHGVLEPGKPGWFWSTADNALAAAAPPPGTP